MVDRNKHPQSKAPRPAEVEEDLPLVRLPSSFHPERFQDLTKARGARPASLKQIDDLLTKIESSDSARERFDALLQLQVAVDQFILRYTKDNPRRKAATTLKRWVDGAVRLRAEAFTKDDD